MAENEQFEVRKWHFCVEIPKFRFKAPQFGAENPNFGIPIPPPPKNPHPGAENAELGAEKCFGAKKTWIWAENPNFELKMLFLGAETANMGRKRRF